MVKENNIVEEKPKASQFRKPIYEYINKLLGRDLTNEEHDELKKMFVAYIQAHGESAKPPIKREIVCKKCKTEWKGEGDKFRKEVINL